MATAANMLQRVRVGDGNPGAYKGAELSDNICWGWDEIGAYIGKSRDTAMRYARTRRLPFHRIPGGGSRPPIFALKHELDQWLSGGEKGTPRGKRTDARTSVEEIAGPVLARILGIGQETKLYRRNYVMRADLRPALRGVEIKFDYSFELCNAADTVEPFVQELTVDDGDHGFVESMSFLTNGKSVYLLKRPVAVEKHIGYVSYRAPEQKIRPTKARMAYVCRASWVIERSGNDIWYNHMILPTVGVKIETRSMPGFEITRSFSVPGLVMKGEHLDVAWRKRS